MSDQRRRKSGDNVRHLRAVPDLPVEVAVDPDPVDFVETIYAALAGEIGRLRKPLDIECSTAGWLAMVTSMIRSAVPDGERDEALSEFLATVVELALRDADPPALAVLRAFSALSGTPISEVADAAAGELAASGVADRAWVTQLGRIEATSCLRYDDVDGSQESLLIGFRYDRSEHAIVVLIDHNLGGGIKDCWITEKTDTARSDAWAAAAINPAIEVGEIDWTETDRVISAALQRPLCGESPDQVRDAELYMPLLVRRAGVIRGALLADRSPSLVEGTPLAAPPAGVPRAAVAKKKPPAGRSRSSGPALQLKVMLAGSKPPIWRRLMVPESITLERLHHVIQIAFGWTDSHLHLFQIGEADYGPDGDWAEVRSERLRLSRLVAVGERFSYVYDFGDDWRHVIQVEKRLPAGPESLGPRCVTGRRSAPPEDCGGVWGYQDLLDDLSNPDHAEPERLNWAVESLGLDLADLATFDPAKFDVAQINEELSKLGR